MKKTYNKPTAEKLAFKYRDQVVVASGGDSNGGGSNPYNRIPGFGCKVYLFEFAGNSWCDNQ